MNIGLAIVLLERAGSEINEKNITEVLHAAGFEDGDFSQQRIKASIAALEGQDVTELVEGKMNASMPEEPEVEDVTTLEDEQNSDNDDGDDEEGEDGDEDGDKDSGGYLSGFGGGDSDEDEGEEDEGEEDEDGGGGGFFNS